MRSGVTEALRHRIIDGTLPPGTRVAEEWVSNEMGVSRGPVREALRALENEGLVIVNAYRGTVVSEITTDELRNILIPVRLILEREACLRALPTMTEKDFQVLDDIADQMGVVAAAGQSGALLALVDLDVSYHEYLTELGGQYHTLQIWRTIQPRIRAGFYRLGSRHRDLREICDEHKALLAALRTRDPRVAVDALEIHICTTQLELLDHVGGSVVDAGGGRGE
jgi:DNA-binding GntR family transcriptional regulator